MDSREHQTPDGRRSKDVFPEADSESEQASGAPLEVKFLRTPTGFDIPIKHSPEGEGRLRGVRQDLAHGEQKLNSESLPVQFEASSFSVPTGNRGTGKFSSRIKRWLSLGLVALGITAPGELEAAGGTNAVNKAAAKGGKTDAVPVLKASPQTGSTNIYRYDQAWKPTTPEEIANARKAREQLEQDARARAGTGASVRLTAAPGFDDSAQSTQSVSYGAPDLQALREPNANRIAPYPANRIGAYPANRIEPYPANAIAPHPANRVEPYPANRINQYPANSVGSYPANRVDSYPANTVNPYPAKTVEPYPANVTRAYTSGTVPHYESNTMGSHPPNTMPPYQPNVIKAYEARTYGQPDPAEKKPLKNKPANSSGSEQTVPFSGR